MITNEITKEEPHLSFEPAIKLPETPKVEHNLNVIKNYAEELKDFWQPVLFTSEQLDKAKEVKAGINKLVKQVADLRKETVKKYKESIDDFEKTAKETEAILKEASEVLSNKINVFVQQEQEAKSENILRLINGILADSKTDITDGEIAWDPKWLNKTYKMSQIEEDVKNQINNILTVKETKRLAKENLRLKLDQLDPEGILNHEVYVTKLDYVDNVDLVFASATNDFEELKRSIMEQPILEIDDIFNPTTYKVTFEGSFEEIQKLKEFAKANNIKEV